MTLRRILADYTKNESKSARDWRPFWGTKILIQIGSLLAHLFLKIAKVSVKRKEGDDEIIEEVQAVKHVIEYYMGKRYGLLIYDPAMFNLLASNPYHIAPWCLPMVVPPLPWITWTSGGYLQYRTEAIRISHNIEHREFVRAADEANHLTFTQRSLDILGATAWIINLPVYRVAAHYWNAGLDVPCIPKLDIPPLIQQAPKDAPYPVRKAIDRQVAARERLIRNNFSQRCDANYKLDIARAVYFVKFSFWERRYIFRIMLISEAEHTPSRPI